MDGFFVPGVSRMAFFLSGDVYWVNRLFLDALLPIWKRQFSYIIGFQGPEVMMLGHCISLGIHPVYARHTNLPGLV